MRLWFCQAEMTMPVKMGTEWLLNFGRNHKAIFGHRDQPQDSRFR